MLTPQKIHHSPSNTDLKDTANEKIDDTISGIKAIPDNLKKALLTAVERYSSSPPYPTQNIISQMQGYGKHRNGALHITFNKQY